MSIKIYNGHPVWGPHTPTYIFPAETMESTKRMGYRPFHCEMMLIHTHGPTHVDALNEYADPDSDVMSIIEVPLDWCYGPGICLDVSGVEPNTWIMPEDLESALEESGLEIPEGGTVLLYEGHYEENYGTDEWFKRYPGLGVEASNWLADRGVRNVGVDAPSIDKGDDPEQVAHEVFKNREMLNTENLCNLKKVVNKKFTYIGLPLKINEDATASPIRAVALLEE